jgi:DNA-binding response OmpR family regulator
MSTVLLIEDNQENADMTIRILQSAAYDVIHTLRGFEGARIARRQRPDVTLLDFDLPDVDGRTLVSLLKKQLGPDSPPIIAVTARTGVAEMRLAEELGCDGFVSKPFMPDELLQVIGQVLEKSS